MVLRKTKLTLALLAGILGFGCAPDVSQRSVNHPDVYADAMMHHLEQQVPHMSKGRKRALESYVANQVKRVFMKYEGLFYKAGFDDNGDGVPDVFMMGRWQYNKGKKVPSSDFALICRVKPGEAYFDKDFKVEHGPPDVNCNFFGRQWVTPRYLSARLEGTDAYTTDKMRKEK